MYIVSTLFFQKIENDTMALGLYENTIDFRVA